MYGELTGMGEYSILLEKNKSKVCHSGFIPESTLVNKQKEKLKIGTIPVKILYFDSYK